MKSLKDNKTINNNFRIDAPVEKIYVKLTRENEGNKTKAYLNFYADPEAKLPIIAPARITFNLNNFRMFVWFAQNRFHFGERG